MKMQIVQIFRSRQIKKGRPMSTLELQIGQNMRNNNLKVRSEASRQKILALSFQRLYGSLIIRLSNNLRYHVT